MCGINAIISFEQKLNINSITKMMDCVFHRGPDMNGSLILFKERILLGHQRLSIIDKSRNGIQPMSIDNQNLSIVFNGEIYNFKELKELIPFDLRDNLVSGSDTEVLLYLYKYFGEKMVDLIQGMWAFVIVDQINEKVFISRDRVGMKPLYYLAENHVFLVASEIKSIIATKYYETKVDFDALNEYLTFQNILSDRTLFQDIKILMPGHNIIIDLKTQDITFDNYWDLSLSESDDRSEEELVLELDKRLDIAISKHRIGDRKIGLNLSGGLDSSTILAYLTKYQKNIDTFTGYFAVEQKLVNDRSNNENALARLLSNKFKTEHHELLINSSDVLATIDELSWHLEDPRTAMSYTFYLMSKLVSEHVTVNLSGTGGDELFGGYPWRYELILGVNEDDFYDTYYGIWNRILTNDNKKIALKRDILDRIDLNHPRKVYNKIMANTKGLSPMNKALYFDFKTLLHGFLIVEDKLGMASSIETRFPFLDYDLIQFVSNLPVKYKFNGLVSKALLRKTVSSKLPEEILNSKKQGFTPPDYSWYKNEINAELKSRLLGSKSNVKKIFEEEYIQSIFSEMNDGNDNRMIIWSLLYIDSWIHNFKPVNL
jgi:asparagine synthase (glutamine-hydrolysing)